MKKAPAAKKPRPKTTLTTASIGLSFLDAGPSFEEREGFGEELVLEASDDSGKREVRLFVPADPPEEPEPQG
jgi:hypothetical protein